MSPPLLPKGHLSCLSKAFRYTPAAGTDVAKTFVRVRRQLARNAQEVCEKVRPLERHKEGGR